MEHGKRYYQWRSPQQIQMRLDTRNSIPKSNTGIFSHVNQKDWRETLVDREDVILDTGVGVQR